VGGAIATKQDVHGVNSAAPPSKENSYLRAIDGGLSTSPKTKNSPGHHRATRRAERLNEHARSLTRYFDDLGLVDQTQVLHSPITCNLSVKACF